jgi:hypothetical protein
MARARRPAASPGNVPAMTTVLAALPTSPIEVLTYDLRTTVIAWVALAVLFSVFAGVLRGVIMATLIVPVAAMGSAVMFVAMGAA